MDHTEKSMEPLVEASAANANPEKFPPAADSPAEAASESESTEPVPGGISPEADSPAEAASESESTEPVPGEISPAADSPAEEPSDETLAAAMEAILFAMGDAVSIGMLAQALRITEERAAAIAALLAERCARPESGLVLNRYEDAIQLSTKPELLEYLIRIASEPKKPRLTPTLLETLSIVAFKQPVTRMEVENIRGVNSDFAINRLVSFDLVEEVGRKEVPGRPLLFGTTEQFLRSFGLSSVDELPEPDASRIEEFREEAEEEVSTGLNV